MPDTFCSFTRNVIFQSCFLLLEYGQCTWQPPSKPQVDTLTATSRPRHCHEGSHVQLHFANISLRDSCIYGTAAALCEGVTVAILLEQNRGGSRIFIGGGGGRRRLCMCAHVHYERETRCPFPFRPGSRARSSLKGPGSSKVFFPCSLV